MAITNDFMEAVRSGKLLRVRIMLKDALLVDPTAEQFDKMEAYAAARLSGLYVGHDGELLVDDTASWHEEYLNKQMVAVVNNFSKERIALLKRMVSYIYRDKVEKNRIDAYAGNDGAQRKSAPDRKRIGTGIAAVGAALLVGGVCLSNTIVAVGGAAGAAVGIAMILTDRKG